MALFRDFKYLGSSVFLALVLTSIRSVLVLRILGPALMGAWKTAMLFYTAGEFARLGVSRGIGIRVPILTGKGVSRESNRVASAGGTFALLAGLFLGVITICFGFLVSNRDLRTALWFMAVIVTLAQPNYFLRELATARHLFSLRAKETVIVALFDVTVTVLVSKVFKLIGFGTASVTTCLISFLYLWRGQGWFRVRIRPDITRIRDLVRVGLPYSLSEGAFELTRRLDVLLMAMVLGPTYVGYYGISLLVMDFSAMFAQKGIAQVLSPHLLREFGRTGSYRDVAPFYEMPARLMGYLLPPMLGVGSLIIGDFVRLILPQYIPGIAAAQITMWGIFFISLHSSVSSFFVAAEMIPIILKCYSVLIPVGALAQYAVMKSGLGLTGAASTTLALLAIAVAVELYITRRTCGQNLREIVVFLGSLYLPVACCIAFNVLQDELNFGRSFAAPLATGLKILLLLLFYTPVLVAYELKFSILRAVRHQAT